MSSRNCAKDYKKHLEKCFKYISNNPDINAKCYDISGHAKSIFSKLKSYKSAINWSLLIEPPWKIPIENDKNFRNHSAYLLISGIMEVRDLKFTRYSFSVCIVKGNNIIRRFHFDVGTGSTGILKPICHMQYGGKAHELNSDPNLNYHLDPSIEKPRFPFPPIDFILLLDLLLRQFNTTLGKKFIEERNWKRLVKESERYRLQNYYFQIHRYFNNINNKRHTLFEELCY